jgi:hypothetical protein
MFHRQCVVSLPKNAGYFPAEFVHETKRAAAAQHFVQCLFCGGRSGMAAACALAMFSGKMFLIQQFGASADAPNCVFHEFTL